MTTNWQPINTAPNEQDCLITDGEYFAVGKTWLYTEPDTLGYDNGPLFGNTLRRNPDAGKTRWIWLLNGCTAYSSESFVGCNWDHEVTDFIPTHWAPVIQPPATELQPSEPSDISVQSTNP